MEDLKEMPAEHIQVRASEFSNETVRSFVTYLIPKNDLEWKEKLTALFHGLATRDQLEITGKSLIAKQALVMLETSKKYESKHLWKLSPLFVGISHEAFLQLLAMANQEQLETLQHEALSESIQHQLNVLAHDIEQQYKEIVEVLDHFAKEMNSVNMSTISSKQFREMSTFIEDIHDHLERWLIIVNRALLLSWNTIRTDLIEKFNLSKEQLIKTREHVIGSPRSNGNLPTGMYTFFEKVYGNESDPKDFEALTDSEPAIEALNKLSIWYLSDFWEVGLLPEIHHESELRLDPTKHSEKECAEHRESLFKAIQENLKKAKLETVADLKNAQILTKKMLKSYIQSYLL